MVKTDNHNEFKGYVVSLCAFIIIAVMMGITNNFGIVLPTLLEEFNVGRTLTALVGSLQYGLAMLLGPVAGSLINRFDCRVVAIAGGFLHSVGLMTASFATNIYVLFPTYSVIFGVANSFLYTSSYIAAARCSPSKHRSLITAFVSCGGAFGMLVFAPLLVYLLKTLQWQAAFRALSYLGVIICLLSLSYGWTKKEFTPVGHDDPQAKDITRSKKEQPTWKTPRFLSLLCGSTVSMLGYSVGLFFLADRAKTYGILEERSKWFYFIVAVILIISLLVVGKIGDLIRYRMFWSRLALVLHGINTSLSFLCKTYSTIVAYSLFCGFFMGGYNALLCISILDCVGQKNLPIAFGFLSFCEGLGLAAGSPIAGMLKDKTGSFKVPLIVAGCLEILGVVIAAPNLFVKSENNLHRSSSKTVIEATNV